MYTAPLEEIFAADPLTPLTHLVIISIRTRPAKWQGESLKLYVRLLSC